MSFHTANAAPWEKISTRLIITHHRHYRHIYTIIFYRLTHVHVVFNSHVHRHMAFSFGKGGISYSHFKITNVPIYPHYDRWPPCKIIHNDKTQKFVLTVTTK